MADEWTAWVARHSQIFGFSDAQIAMANSWREVFVACGYGLDDLQAVTDALAVRPPDRPWDHLAAIHAAMRAARAVDYRRESSPEHDWGECGYCGGTGRVTVPYPRGVVDGEWVPITTSRSGASYYTGAVLCSCPLGQWYGERQGLDSAGRPRQMMKLESYSRLNPDWRQQLAGHKRRSLALAGLSRGTSRLDRWWEDLKRHLAASFGFHLPD